MIYCDVREGGTKQQVNASHSEITSWKQGKKCERGARTCRTGSENLETLQVLLFDPQRLVLNKSGPRKDNQVTQWRG